MARTRTLLQMRTDVRELADMPNSSFISDPNLNEYINRGIAKLYGKLVGARGQDYYEKSATFVTVGGQQSYPMSSWTPATTDFFQLLQVEITDGTFKRVLQPFMRKEHAKYSEYTVPAGYTITIYYVPAATRLVADNDAFDGINGWEEYVIRDATIELLNKEESDVSIHQNRLTQIEREIEGLAADRDAGWPERITNVSRTRRAGSPQAWMGGSPMYRLHGNATIDGASPAIDIIWGPISGAWF